MDGHNIMDPLPWNRGTWPMSGITVIGQHDCLIGRGGKPFAANLAAPGGVARLDWALCQWMAEEKGVLCIPSSPSIRRNVHWRV
jgi:hypothetical protein